LSNGTQKLGINIARRAPGLKKSFKFHRIVREITNPLAAREGEILEIGDDEAERQEIIGNRKDLDEKDDGEWNEEEDKECAEEDEEAEQDDGEMREENDKRGEGQMFWKNQRKDDEGHGLGSANHSAEPNEFTSRLRKSKTK
jgi:hypothetical protein